MVDGRATERYAISLPVVVARAAKAGEMEATLRDINSNGGVFLCLHEDADAETSPEIEFAIALPERWMHRDDVRVECKAKVVRLQRDADEVLIGVAAKITGLKLQRLRGPQS